MHHSFTSAILAAVCFSFWAAALSPDYPKFTEKLKIPEVIQPKASINHKGTPMDYYELTVDAVKRKGLFPSMPDVETDFLGYNGQVPGPTFRIKRGTETVVRMINRHNQPKVMHLHGSYSRAPFDGWADDIARSGEAKDYYFPNKQTSRTMFYHDHTNDLTEAQVRSGLGGFYIVEDDEQDAKLKLPKGKYDVPLMLTSPMFLANGQIDPANTGGNHGDFFMVNGVPWPYFEVEPRRYRFRILNSATIRTFKVSIADDETGKVLPMTVIAGDAGYANEPVDTDDLILGMAERYEVVVDFTGYNGKNLTMLNGLLTSPFGEPEYPSATNRRTNNIIQFRVGNTVTDNTNNGPVDFTEVEKWEVHTKKDVPDDIMTLAITRLTTGIKFTLDGRWFNDGNNRVLRNVPRGTTEQWQFSVVGNNVNHPLHVHLVEFQVVGRTGGRALANYERAVQKDVVSVAGSETVDVIAVYAPWSGVYMFHCHNLAHEDAGMMMAFDVTKLKDFGYPESTTALENPMQKEFLAKSGGSISKETAENELLPYFGDLGAYEKPTEVMEALKEYHATHTPTPTGSRADPSATDGYYPIHERSYKLKKF